MLGFCLSPSNCGKKGFFLFKLKSIATHCESTYRDDILYNYELLYFKWKVFKIVSSELFYIHHAVSCLIPPLTLRYWH